MEDFHRPGARAFSTTDWSLVAVAQTGEAGQTRWREAFAELCKGYWYPLYVFVRRRGYAPEEAEDLTQSFFLALIESRGLAAAEPGRGRFRSYLLGALKHFLANEWHRARALKRGGGVTILELEAVDAEARYALQPAEALDSDAEFDRTWAEETTARATQRLKAEWTARGKAELFDVLQPSLTGDEPARSDTAARLGMSEGAVKVAVHRLRQRYREVLRAEVAGTLTDPSDVDSELRHLAAALRSK